MKWKSSYTESNRRRLRPGLIRGVRTEKVSDRESIERVILGYEARFVCLFDGVRCHLRLWRKLLRGGINLQFINSSNI